MSALSYLFRMSIKNWVIQLVKKPATLVFALAMILMMVVVFLPNGNAKPVYDARVYFRTGLFALLGFLTYVSISNGLKKGSTFFSMSDVNFLFTSPIRPQSVLFYGVIRQMGITALTSAFLLFQVPNLRNFFGLNVAEIGVLLLGWFLLAVCNQILSVSIFSLTAPFPSRRQMGKRILYGLVLLLVGGLIVYLLSNGRTINSILGYFELPVMDFFPVVGWFTGFVTNFIAGNYIRSAILLGLSILLPAGALFLVQRSNADYYEDVLQATETYQATRQAMKDGKIGARVSSRSVKVGKTGLMGKGQGSSVFFWRQMTEQRRGRGFFILDVGSFVIIAAGIISAIIVNNLMQKGDVSAFTAELILLGILGYLLFFLSMAGKFMQELSKPYIYLVPDSGVKKLIYANLIGVLKATVEGLIAFTIAAIITGLPAWYVILGTIIYASLAQIYISVQLFTQRILGDHAGKLFQSMFYFLSALLLMGPGFVIFGVLLWITYSGQTFVFAAYLFVILYNVLASALVLFLSRGLLNSKDA